MVKWNYCVWVIYSFSIFEKIDVSHYWINSLRTKFKSYSLSRDLPTRTRPLRFPSNWRTHQGLIVSSFSPLTLWQAWKKIEIKKNEVLQILKLAKISNFLYICWSYVTISFMHKTKNWVQSQLYGKIGETNMA